MRLDLQRWYCRSMCRMEFFHHAFKMHLSLQHGIIPAHTPVILVHAGTSLLHTEYKQAVPAAHFHVHSCIWSKHAGSVCSALLFLCATVSRLLLPQLHSWVELGTRSDTYTHTCNERVLGFALPLGPGASLCNPNSRFGYAGYCLKFEAMWSSSVNPPTPRDLVNSDQLAVVSQWECITNNLQPPRQSRSLSGEKIKTHSV